ncbi:MAG: V4R domain-containing protein, partial [Candidatus Nanohaloarchaea archaeon]
MRYVREYMDCDASSVEESIGKLADVFDSMNLGGLSLRDDEKPFRVELEENAFTYEAPESGRTMCYFISGYIAGFLENCLGKKYVVNEKSCSAEGSGSCIFEIRER